MIVVELDTGPDYADTLLVCEDERDIWRETERYARRILGLPYVPDYWDVFLDD